MKTILTQTRRKHLLYLVFLMTIGFTSQSTFGNNGFELTSQEENWIANHPVVRVIVNNGPPPLSQWGDTPVQGPPPGMPEPVQTPLNKLSGRLHQPPGESNLPLMEVTDSEPGQFKGIAADYLAEIAKLTGLEFRSTFVSHHNFSAMFKALRQGQADLMVVHRLNKAREAPHLRGLHMTHPYVRIPVVVVTRPDVPYIDDIEKLKTMKVAGALSTDDILASVHLRIPFLHIPPRDGLIGVATNRFDAFICELSLVSEELARHPITNIKISGELPVMSAYAMIAGPELGPLVPIFNRALAAIPDKDKDMIWGRWFRVSYEKKLISSFWMKVGLGLGLISLILGIFGFLYYYRKFHRIRTTVKAMDPHLLSVHVDHNIVITDVTQALCEATGFRTDDLLGKPLMALGSLVTESSSSMDTLWKTLKSGRPWSGEVKIAKKDGTVLWAEAAISPLRRKSDSSDGFTIIYQDVTQKKHYESLAVKDELTGLYNRRHFNLVVPDLLKQAEEDGHYFALILMDVDHFKKYNDLYGHPAGDHVLSNVGKSLCQTFQRRGDLVFRIGGEEFAAAVIVSSEKEAAAMTEKILKTV